MKPLIDGSPCHPNDSAPLSQSFGFAIEGYKVVVPFIIGLLRHGSPPAITRGITKAIVNPLKGKSFGWMSHITEKVVELTPTVANRNPSSPVVEKHRVVGVVTPLNHFVPTSVSRCAPKPVRSVSVDENFGKKTPARFCFPTPEWACHYFGGIPAVTLTQPLEILSDAFVFDGCQPSKSEAGYDVGVFHFSSPEKHPMEIARQSGVSLMFGFDGLAALLKLYHKSIGVTS